MYFTVFDLAVEHIANFCQQVCMACRLMYQSRLKHRYTITQTYPGAKTSIKY